MKRLCQVTIAIILLAGCGDSMPVDDPSENIDLCNHNLEWTLPEPRTDLVRGNIYAWLTTDVNDLVEMMEVVDPYSLMWQFKNIEGTWYYRMTISTAMLTSEFSNMATKNICQK